MKSDLTCVWATRLGAGVFFMSFVVVVGIVILNVVVAVLLDEFVESVSKVRQCFFEQQNLKLQSQSTFGVTSVMDVSVTAWSCVTGSG